MSNSRLISAQSYESILINEFNKLTIPVVIFTFIYNIVSKVA